MKVTVASDNWTNVDDHILAAVDQALHLKGKPTARAHMGCAKCPECTRDHYVIVVVHGQQEFKASLVRDQFRFAKGIVILAHNSQPIQHGEINAFMAFRRYFTLDSIKPSANDVVQRILDEEMYKRWEPYWMMCGPTACVLGTLFLLSSLIALSYLLFLAIVTGSTIGNVLYLTGDYLVLLTADKQHLCWQEASTFAHNLFYGGGDLL